MVRSSSRAVLVSLTASGKSMTGPLKGRQRLMMARRSFRPCSSLIPVNLHALSKATFCEPSTWATVAGC
jgi:hypothetical protein